MFVIKIPYTRCWGICDFPLGRYFPHSILNFKSYVVDFQLSFVLYKIKCFRAYQMPGLHSKEGRHSAAFAGWCMRRQLQSVRLGLNGWAGAAAQPASVSKVRSPNPNLEREKTLLLLYPKSVSVVWRWDQAATGWCWLVAPTAALAHPFKFSRIGCCLNCESRKWKIFMYLLFSCHLTSANVNQGTDPLRSTRVLFSPLLNVYEDDEPEDEFFMFSRRQSYFSISI